MKFRLFLAVAALAVGTHGLAAQTVVEPEPKLSPEKQVVNDAIYRVRDSLLLVDAAGARLARDRKQASDASLQSRARLVATRCRAATLESDSTRAIINRGGLPSPDTRDVRGRIENAIGQLRTKLVWCDGEFTRLSQPANAEELRGYSVGKAEQVNVAVRTFMTEVEGYLSVGLGVRYKPSTRGAGAVAAGRPR